MLHNKNGRQLLFALISVVTLVLVEGSARRATASPQNQDQGQIPGQQQQGSFPVGHATRLLSVLGFHGETRHVNVHLWYPAPDPQNCQSGDGNSQGCPPSVYTSRLNGVPILPQWGPLSWTIGSTVAFEELPVSSARSSYPVIIFSHGDQNNAIDYVYTLEALASYGFIVAAPDHVNNTQDDVRIDFVNTQARNATGNPNLTLIPCFDGLASPCAHTSVPESMTDRVNDIRKIIIDGLPSWFGDRADLSRVGVMGHSRGTVTALAAAGGSTTWGFPPVTWYTAQGTLVGVKAVMGLAIGAQAVTFGANLPAVTVPTLLVAGSLDKTLPVSQTALATLGSTDKMLVTIQNAKHRHFDSGYCAQTQSAGAIAQTAEAIARVPSTSRAILDLQTVTNLVIPPPSGGGVAVDFCGFDTFTNPTYIIGLVFQLTGFTVTLTNVPTVPPGSTTGLTSEEVKNQVIQLAVAAPSAFFKRVL